MSDKTTSAPVFAKPSREYRDGGDLWIKDKRGPVKFFCKTCGRRGSGYGTGPHTHWHNCSVDAPRRAEEAKRKAERVTRAEIIRGLLASVAWLGVSDDAAICHGEQMLAALGIKVRP